MINWQQLNHDQLSSQRHEPVHVKQREIDQTPALPSHDEQAKALRPLGMARQHQPLDWLNAAGGSPLARPGVLTLQYTQPQQLQLPIGGGDLMQLQLQSGTATLRVLTPAQLVITPPPDDDDQLLWNDRAFQAETTGPGRYWLENAST